MMYSSAQQLIAEQMQEIMLLQDSLVRCDNCAHLARLKHTSLSKERRICVQCSKLALD